KLSPLSLHDALPIYDNPNEVVLMVHIFADKSALSQALVDSGTISESKYLDAFMAKFMNSQPFLYFMDCGPSEGAVDTKIKGPFPDRKSTRLNSSHLG